MEGRYITIEIIITTGLVTFDTYIVYGNFRENHQGNEAAVAVIKHNHR